MLEHVPQWLGEMMRPLRAGADKLCIAQPELGGDFGPIDLGSPAFAHGSRLPLRFTADGEGISPPLVWGQLPEGTCSLALIVEDPDAPSPDPLVHAIVWGIGPWVHAIPEGAIRPDGYGSENGSDVGLNSFFLEGWLPPDPPTGHGDHEYAFQLFALGQIDHPGASPGRGALVRAMAGRVLGAGLLTGVYSREEAEAARGGLIEEASRTLI
ncbi:MAG: YbhB/YbcL family Raf kinase inhibitor-like protein [Sphingomonadales bacterium]